MTTEEHNSDISHTKRGGLGYYIVAVLIVAVLLGGAFWISDGFFAQKNLTAVWTDGSVITIRGVTAGTNDFSFEPGSGGFLSRILPASLSRILHGNPYRTTIHPPDPFGLNIYMTRQNPTNGASLSTFWGRVDVLDTAGNVFASSPGSSSWGGNAILGFKLESFPRREKTFRLRIPDQSGAHVAEFVINNPFPSTNYPTWTPEALPITKTNGDVQVTLSGLKVVTNWWGKYCNADYKVESSDSSWTTRESTYQWFTDATGNKGPYLSPKESALKFHMQFYRPNGAEFPTNLIWTLPQLSVPNAVCLTNLHASNTVDGIPIWVPIFCGGGVLAVSNGVYYSVRGPVSQAVTVGTSWSSDGSNTVETFGCVHPFAVVETGNLPQSTVITVRFRNSEGHLLSSQNKTGSFGVPVNPEGRTQRQCLELMDTNVDTVSLEIVVNRPKEFEFIVKPPVP